MRISDWSSDVCSSDLLIRPTLYEAWHDILAVEPREGRIAATIVGPVCETGDTFAEDRPISPVDAGDLIAFMTAGAYGATMASTYNSRSEEHTSELQSLLRISYAVFDLKKKKRK